MARNGALGFCVFLSDGASEISGEIDNSISTGIFNTEVTRRFLCHYHVVNIKAMKDLTCLKNDFEFFLRDALLMLIFPKNSLKE
jgi:hypothetical protein